MTKQKKPTVLIIEASAKAALPVIKSLAQTGCRVVAADTNRINSGFFSRYCHERHIYKSCRDFPDEFKQWLLSFLAERDIDQLFPVGHYGTLAVSEIQDKIRKHTRLLLPPHQIFLNGYAKIPTLQAAERADVPIPKTWFPQNDDASLNHAIKQIDSWPILIKPSVAAGANGITWCHSPNEIKKNWPMLTNKHGQCFLQDFVPPGGMQHKVDMLVDDKQNLLAGVVYGKTRMYPPDGGSSVLNYTVHRPDILESAHKMLVELKWNGFCDFDFIDDPRDNTSKLMEINPRFPESLRACYAAEVDFARMIYDYAHGEKIEPVNDYPENRFLRFFPGDVLWYLRAGKKRRKETWPSWFRFFDSSTIYQICSLSDPGPILGYLLQNALQMISDRRIRRERLRLDSGNKQR